MTDTGFMHQITPTGERNGRGHAVTRVLRWDSLDSNGWYADLNDPPLFEGTESQMFYPDHLYEFDAEAEPN